MKRNLIYNCCPLKGAEEIIRDNVAKLCEHGAIFNGRKIVNIKTGDNLEDPSVVRKLFTSLGNVEFVEYGNDRELGEYVGFFEGLQTLKSLDKNEITFYGHTKGVGPRNRPPLASTMHVGFIRHWYSKMYEHCLSDPEWIDNIMYEHSAAGCYRIRRYEGDGRWIFAGAFYWINHYRLFSKTNWDDVPKSKWTPEAYFLDHAFDWRDTFDLFTRFTINCQQCGRFNYVPSEPIDPRFDTCPKCGQKSLINVPIVPGDLDDDDSRPRLRGPSLATGPFKRNLIYNCCPLKGAEAITRDNVAWLVKYAKAFTGRKIINIKTGDGCESTSEIERLFRPLGEMEINYYRNDPAVGEYLGFLDGLKALQSADDREITLYAHTKGVAAYNRKPENRLESIRQWYRRMYHECLRDPERIDKIMTSFSVCGAFYKRRPIPHFSGAFYWLNHAKLYSNSKWDKEPEPNAELDAFIRSLAKGDNERKRFFVEMYPGIIFHKRDFYDLHPIPENHNPYVMPHKKYVCRGCKKQFVAGSRGRVACPKCGTARPTVIGWPELGF